ncbi:MAG: homoserine kinase [Aggregatilineales bacterium]
MLKVTVTVPAACTGLGPGLESFSLALGLRETLEFSVRADSQLALYVHGEGDRAPNLRHPALRAAIAVFQSQERAPAGLSVSIQSRIPVGCGLGDVAALTVGGLLGANNVVDTPLKRDELIAMACQLTGLPTAPIAALLGGLVVTSNGRDHERLYRRVNVAADALKAVIVLPDLAAYSDPFPTLAPVSLTALSQSYGRAALMMEAFRAGDWSLLTRTLSDPLVEPGRRALITGADEAIAAAREAGALCTVVSGSGPALIAFALVNHKRIEDSLQRAFAGSNIRSRVWTANVDTQGVTVSVSR